ncbi:MAG TPA: BatA domain-containing protein, partial [Xanthobacteraceae bacterium]
MSILSLGFAQPLALIGLLSLPVLWWLLRLIPPRPRRVAFPPTRLLFDIAPKEETPARTPWWLTLLRLTLAALVIIAAAGPLWNPPIATSQSKVPLALLIDDGWSAASTWDQRMRTIEDLIARAETDNRGVALVALSEPRDISLEMPAAARVRLRQISPKPHAIERTDALLSLTRFLAATPGVEVVWLSDGVDLGRAGEFVDGLARILDRRSLTVITGGLPPAHALTAADNAAAMLTVKVLRSVPAPSDAGFVRALDLKGLPLGEAPFAFGPNDTETEAQFGLPVEIRNDIARIEIVSERSAGAVQILDKRWRRRTVGVVTGSTAETAQPLLSATYYLARALAPFADARVAERGSPAEAVNGFLEQRVPMMVLADVGNVAGEARERLVRWVEDGGVLVRFAGPRLAAGDDELVPVRLRRGGRILGGSLSWDQPQRLASLARESPFGGMSVPDDVTVTRQVLAEPDAALAERTWAALADGTPLVTAARRGKGMIVLFHVTAD